MQEQDEQAVTTRLEQEFGYPRAAAQAASAGISVMSPQVARSFWRWWNQGIEDHELSVQGYTLRRLMSEHNMNRMAAYLTLDWLTKDPASAADSLERGHDSIC